MRTLLWLGAMLCALSTAAARAQDAERAIDLTLAGPQRDVEALEATLDDLLDEVHVRIRVARLPAIDPRSVIEPPADRAPALARVWVAVEPGHALVYLADAAWERVLVRRVPLQAGMDEIGREQVGQIVRAAVEALLAGAQIGLTRQRVGEQLGITPAATTTPPPPIGSPAMPAEPTIPLRTELHVRYAARGWDGGPVLQHVLGLRLGVRIGRGNVVPIALVGARYRLPIRARTASLRVEVQGVDLQLAGGIELRLGGRTAARFTAGVLLELTSSKQRAAGTPGVTAGPPLEFMTPMIALEAALMHAVTPWLQLLVSVGVDIDLVNTRYLVDTAVVLEPWHLRPVAAVGVALTP